MSSNDRWVSSRRNASSLQFGTARTKTSYRAQRNAYSGLLLGTLWP
jgi:hypothetical protein